MKIVLDIDEVLRDTMRGILKVYNRDYNNSELVQYEDVNGWNLKNSLPDMPNNELFFRKHAEEIFLESEPHRYNNLFNSVLEHDVYIASTQFKGLEHLTDAWLAKYKITSDELVYTSDKSKMGDILLDDGVHNLKDFEGISVCMDRPWNKEWNGDRVKTIKEFYEKYVR